MDHELLLQAIQILEKRPGKIRPIKEIAYHSEQVSFGCLFVCIKGYRTDGHLFLPRAAEKGAVAAVVEHFQEEVKLPQYRVADSRQALASLADRFYDHPSSKLKTIGITATNGKTTTTYMINAILEAHGLKTGLIGTVIVKIGDTVQPADLTTPESLDLHRFLHQMVEQDISHVTMEVSSSGLELKRVGSVDFDIVAINNISREHIDLHGSYDAYFNAKASLVREAKPHQWAIFNLDCQNSAPLIKQTKAKVLTYSINNENADCVVKDLDLSTGRARFTVEIFKEISGAIFPGQPASFPIELSVLGLHSVYNAMVAVLASLLCGVPVTTIQQALRKFGGVERRFELIYNEEFMVIDDHFANSGNIHVTLETLRMMQYKKLHLVYAIRGSRGFTVNRENAEAIACWAPLLGLETIIATTSNAHVTNKDIVTEEELQAFKTIMDEAGIKTEIYDELPDAIDRGLSRTGPKDILLLAGCQGMDFGARICLDQIHREKPHLGHENIFAALKNRIAGR